jgi:asparagine synthase (glutamine-hydrolysing)
MCGISCLLGPASPELAHALKAMTEQIRHRGPDDEGYMLFGTGHPTSWYGDDTPVAVLASALPSRPAAHVSSASEPVCLGFGHRRLAIVDTTPLGHQPMSYASGRYWITYNGQVYNHIELREELQRLGHPFASHSDTEVILAAYAQWGEDCLARFNGMWALAIFDAAARTLFVARDRFGVKPLYYWAGPDGHLAIGSEIKQFAVLPGWSARLNAQRGYDFLVWNVSDHTDETLFNRVFQLLPGHSMLLNLADWPLSVGTDGRLPARAWYQLNPPAFEGSFDEAVGDFRHLMTDSVRLRLRADVPVGSCLSGGLDSSTIVCVMRRLLDEEGGLAAQVTVSACSDVASVDERAWIDLVVQRTGVQAHYVTPGLEGLFSALPALAWHQDEPFCSTSIYAQWCVFRDAAGIGLKVMLDGQGADEQLAGYHGFLGPRLASLLRRARLIELAREILALRLLGYSPLHAAKLLADMLLRGRLRQRLRHAAGKSSAWDNPWLDAARLGHRAIDSTAASGRQARSIRELSLSLLQSGGLPMLLHWEDRNSMAHGIESRVPFLDYRLVEFAVSLPDEYKLRRGLTKRVLRDSMKGILLEPVRCRRDKIGFATPEETWMRKGAPERFRAALRTAVDQSHGILTPHALTYLEDVLAGRRAFSFLPWRMISFGAWIDCFGVKPD